MTTFLLFSGFYHQYHSSGFSSWVSALSEKTAARDVSVARTAQKQVTFLVPFVLWQWDKDGKNTMALEKVRQMSLDPIESTSGKNITNQDDGSESTNKFVSSLVINLAVALVAISLFSFLRPRLKRIYSPRQLLLDMMFPLGKLPNSFFAWIIPAFMANDDDVFYYAGIDALVYMRFLKLCIKISLVIMPYGIAVLLPLNYYGKGGLHGLDKVALSNVTEGSTKLWAHLVAAWFYTVIICYLLYEEWKVYIMYRQEHLTCGKGHQYAVLLRDLPVKVRKHVYSCLKGGGGGGVE